MSPETQNGRSVERFRPSHADSHSQLDSTAPTACEHLAQARHWLDLAERQWTSDAGLCQAAARIAELHILMADRVADLGACGG